MINNSFFKSTEESWERKQKKLLKKYVEAIIKSNFADDQKTDNIIKLFSNLFVSDGTAIVLETLKQIQKEIGDVKKAENVQTEGSLRS
jgi:hypothetical protein